MAMTAPTITRERFAGVDEALGAYAPHQGGIEYQTDRPAKVHAWHKHDAHETLVVLEGTMLLEWVVAPVVGGREAAFGSQQVTAGDVISLPAHTVHQSTNGDTVCRYLILPEGGVAAETTQVGSPR